MKFEVTTPPIFMNHDFLDLALGSVISKESQFSNHLLNFCGFMNFEVTDLSNYMNPNKLYVSFFGGENMTYFYQSMKIEEISREIADS